MDNLCKVCGCALAPGAICCPRCGSAAEPSVAARPAPEALSAAGEITAAEAAAPSAPAGKKSFKAGFCRVFFSAFFCAILMGGIFTATLLGGFRAGFCDGRFADFLDSSGFYELMSGENEGPFSGRMSEFFYDNMDADVLEEAGLSREALGEIFSVYDSMELEALSPGEAETVRQIFTLGRNPAANFLFIALIVFDVLVCACLFLFNHRKLGNGFLYAGCPLALNGLLFGLVGLWPARMAMEATGFGPLADVSIYAVSRTILTFRYAALGCAVLGVAFILLSALTGKRARARRAAKKAALSAEN